MADEPPPEFVEFVTERLSWVQSEAARMTGSAPVDLLGPFSEPTVRQPTSAYRPTANFQADGAYVPAAGGFAETGFSASSDTRPANGLAALVLTDVALHWRRLTLRKKLSHADAVREFVKHRLEVRTKQWRDDQIYAVEVRILRPVVRAAHLPATMAVRKADFLASSVAADGRPMAEAAIAWAEARRRAMWHRVYRTTITIVLLFAIFLSLLPTPPD
jgi:hypothetical protein